MANPSLKEEENLDNSWLLVGDTSNDFLNSSELSIISSCNDDLNNDYSQSNESSSISLKPDISYDEFLRSFELNSTDNFLNQSSNSSADLNINELLPILKDKQKTKINEMLNKALEERSKMFKSITSENIPIAGSSPIITNDSSFSLPNNIYNPVLKLIGKPSLLKRQLEESNDSLLSIIKKSNENKYSNLKSKPTLQHEMFKLDKESSQSPVKLLSPFHGEPDIDLDFLIKENQSEIQSMLVLLKQQNQEFVNAILNN
jgi:hypothetical protein